MNPSDTQITRMAQVFAERCRPDDTPVPAARRAWTNALNYARAAGSLDHMERRMSEDTQDTQIRAAWSRAREK